MAERRKNKRSLEDAGTSDVRRVNFEEFMEKEGNRKRPLNIPHIRQFEDSLIARGYGEPQRLAILATSAQEMGKAGANSHGVGGNGYLGYNTGRMPISLVDDTTTVGRGKQIKYLLDDLQKVHSDNWLDGGSGGPKIMTGKEGYELFWNATDPRYATQVLNKSNIRPRDREDAWNNRADVAEAMQRHLYKYGGIHIKPSKRGSFTAAAKRRGLGVQAFARRVLANRGKYSAAMIKKANFARNAARWH